MEDKINEIFTLFNDVNSDSFVAIDFPRLSSALIESNASSSYSTPLGINDITYYAPCVPKLMLPRFNLTTLYGLS